MKLLLNNMTGWQSQREQERVLMTRDLWDVIQVPVLYAPSFLNAAYSLVWMK